MVHSIPMLMIWLRGMRETFSAPLHISAIVFEIIQDVGVTREWARPKQTQTRGDADENASLSSLKNPGLRNRRMVPRTAVMSVTEYLC